MYRLNEIFYSLQGEGHYSGAPAVFVRFAGCNRRCSFCDTDYAVRETLELEELLLRIDQLIKDTGCTRVILTGGEPALQVDEGLVKKMRDELYAIVHMETNGTVKVPRNLDWLTVSPKDPGWSYGKIADVVDAKIDELKVVVNSPAFRPPIIPSRAVQLYLSPMFRGDVIDKGSLNRAVNIVKQNMGWRLTMQAHKVWGIR